MNPASLIIDAIVIAVASIVFAVEAAIRMVMRRPAP
jgi:multisubunit Na+/H+ antiporter MnhC subunit